LSFRETATSTGGASICKRFFTLHSTAAKQGDKTAVVNKSDRDRMTNFNFIKTSIFSRDALVKSKISPPLAGGDEGEGKIT
jgi:hypothetical protein